MTKLNFGIIGHNISYSQSPKIFNSIFTCRQIEGEFTVYDFPEKEFDKHLPLLRELNGFSVTIPFKEKMLEYSDEISDSARTIQAVNSVKVENSRFVGFNTDGDGFIYGLKRLILDKELQNILIIGYGGAARAIICALIKNFKIESITVCGRKNLDSDKLLNRYFSYVGLELKILYSVVTQLNRSVEYDLIVNCSPCGDINHRNEFPLPEDFEFNGCGICYDLIYIPARTLLLSKAAESGWQVVNGYPMLVRQAVESYKIWSGDDISVDKFTQDLLLTQEEQV
ncbi:MAG: shikimate dehydrogenase [candidate division Zixibacteria bacterium]